MILTGCASFQVHQLNEEKAEGTVMNEGMTIAIHNSDLTLSIQAGKGLKRYYTWNGETRSVTLLPRLQKWHGSHGAYFPGTGNHWEEHDGVTRVLADEAVINYESYDHLICAISDRRNNFREKYYKYRNGEFDFQNTLPLALETDNYGAYNDTGLFVSAKIAEGPGNNRTLYATVYQLQVNGKPAKNLPGASDERITVNLVE